MDCYIYVTRLCLCMRKSLHKSHQFCLYGYTKLGEKPLTEHGPIWAKSDTWEDTRDSSHGWLGAKGPHKLCPRVGHTAIKMTQIRPGQQGSRPSFLYNEHFLSISSRHYTDGHNINVQIYQPENQYIRRPLNLAK